MAEAASIEFLKWCLPRLGLRFAGFRKVRRLLGKRLGRRMAELRLPDLAAYRAFLLAEPGEWARLDRMCRVPISRFYRDREVFAAIGCELLPEVAAMAKRRGGEEVRSWSAGCASGEEPYTLAMAWRFCVAPSWPQIALTVIATDAEEVMIERAKVACYKRSSLEELPPEWTLRSFVRSGPLFCLAAEFRESVEFRLGDIRQTMPDGPFDLVLCRNLVFTYFEEALQRRVLSELRARIRPEGFLVIGKSEALPADAVGFAAIAPSLPIYRARSVAGL